MKNRILSVALAVALLITLIPLGALDASAASELSVSDDCIATIKKWEGFSAKPYWDYSQWTVGYGTRVPDGKLDTYKASGISEAEAETLLREHLDTTCRSLNSFCDKFGLTLNQGQFDALVSLSFNCGTGWLYKTSTLRTAIIEGWTGNDLLFAMGQWSTAGGSTLPALIRRRLAEVNMYANGVYSTTVPDNYCYVRFNANGGSTVIVTQGYDSNTPDEIRAVPTYEGYNFEGWYTDPTGGEKVTVLDAGVRNYTLYAHWSAGSGADLPQDEAQGEITGTAVSYNRQIATGVLNSFVQPVKGALVVNAYKLGDVVQISAEHTDSSNVKWGKIVNGGWINLGYTQEPTTNSTPTGGVKVTVTNNAVNVRRGPGTGYARVGSVNKGDQLTITETASGSGYVWGKADKGWVALKYTNYDSVTNSGSGDSSQGSAGSNTGSTGSSDSGSNTVIATGKVAVTSGKLNIRKGPGTGYASVGSLSKGTAVQIYEKTTVGTMEWGRIDKGWISLTYVKLDGQSADQGQTPDSGNTGSGSDTSSGTATGGSTANGGTSNDSSTSNGGASSDGSASNGAASGDSGASNGGSASTALTGKVTVTSGRLHVRSGPGTNHSVVSSLAKGTAVTITEQTTVNGTAWGKISNGWVCMNYITLDSAAGSSDVITGKVSTGTSRLRIRSTPSSSATIAGYLSNGDTVVILEKKTVDGTVWGRIDKGWISMQYVSVGGSTSTGTSQTAQGKTVTVTASCLRIRSGAGTNNKIVGRLYTGEKVTVLETKDVNGVQWGRTSKGWICMDYVK